MRCLLGPLAALLLSFPVAAHAADPLARKSNIVFILVDDMPYAGPRVTGNTLLETPHIDRIAREGHFADFLPTLCAAAGAEIPSEWPLDGVSLLPLFAGGTIPVRTLFASYPHYLAEFATTPVRAVIEQRYKLVWHPYDHIEIEGAGSRPRRSATCPNRSWNSSTSRPIPASGQTSPIATPRRSRR